MLALSEEDKALYLCTPTTDFGELVTASGVAMTSTSLMAETLHALSHFAFEKANYETVTTDIACMFAPQLFSLSIIC